MGSESGQPGTSHCCPNNGEALRPCGKIVCCQGVIGRIAGGGGGGGIAIPG